jgi:hypothetical protein
MISRKYLGAFIDQHQIGDGVAVEVVGVHGCPHATRAICATEVPAQASRRLYFPVGSI